jgi:hypothetical protein
MDALKPLARTFCKQAVQWCGRRRSNSHFMGICQTRADPNCMYGLGHVQVRKMAPQLKMNRAEWLTRPVRRKLRQQARPMLLNVQLI